LKETQNKAGGYSFSIRVVARQCDQNDDA